jgi:DNA-binding MurR/RpiR family transcriptional regulator
MRDLPERARRAGATIEIARDARALGLTVHGLSDDESGPLSELVATQLVAREDEVAGFRAPTAAMALTTALCVAAGSAREMARHERRASPDGIHVPL